jgi:hypothetical protein
VTNNLFSSNDSGSNNGFGGGAYISSPGVFSFSGNMLVENNSRYGGGVCLFDSGTIIENNIFKSNTATYGGGIRIRTSTSESDIKVPVDHPQVVNNTLVNNSATSFGGGLIGNADPLVMNSIFWNNSAPNGAQVYPGTHEVHYCDVQGGYPGTGNIDLDPGFADSDYRLLPGSPCIDAAIDSLFAYQIWWYAPDEDFGGNPRPDPVGQKFDIGAWEYPSQVVSVPEPLPGNGTGENVILLPNYPNPFNPSTSIKFVLATSGHVRLRIFGLDGHLVCTLVDDTRNEGLNHARWNGRNASGESVASGVYFYQLDSGGTRKSGKMVLMK